DGVLGTGSDRPGRDLPRAPGLGPPGRRRGVDLPRVLPGRVDGEEPRPLRLHAQVPRAPRLPRSPLPTARRAQLGAASRPGRPEHSPGSGRRDRPLSLPARAGTGFVCPRLPRRAGRPGQPARGREALDAANSRAEAPGPRPALAHRRGPLAWLGGRWSAAAHLPAISGWGDTGDGARRANRETAPRERPRLPCGPR